jgi:hypothetical protein
MHPTRLRRESVLCALHNRYYIGSIVLRDVTNKRRYNSRFLRLPFGRVLLLGAELT